MRHLLKPLSFLPALLIMYMIFGFSSDQGPESSALSYTVSRKIVETVDEVGDFQWSDAHIEHYTQVIHPKVRKAAHMTEYALLAAAVSFPLYVYGLHGIGLMIIAGGFCVAFACMDEYHQTFVSGRSGQFTDVCIDSIGIIAGIICVRIVGFIGRKTIFKPKKRRKRKSR